MSDDDELIFLDDVEPEAMAGCTWKVAIIDDDRAVHDGTRYALSDFALHGCSIEILSAYSAAEGRELVLRHPDLAVILLDVVMESESAGLELVEFIRREARNEIVRIILRTGQPGQAPERRIIVDYDINDYKAKTELTADKLFTALTAALRSYQQLSKLEETRRGLEIIIDAAATIYDLRSMNRLAEGVLTQIGSLLKVNCAGILVLREAPGAQGFQVIAGSGVYGDLIGRTDTPISDRLFTLVRDAFANRGHRFLDDQSALYVSTASGREVVVALDAGKRLSETDRALIELFCGKLSIAFDNVLLYKQLKDANENLEERVIDRTRALSDANDRLSLQREMLRRANAFKNDVLGMVAHELKNPIGVILGRTEIIGELIERGTIDPAVIRTQLTRIVEPANAMTRMIEHLLSDAMNDALEAELRPELFELREVVADIVESYRPAAERKEQSLMLATGPATHVVADPDLLREAIDNLVSNAVKYTQIGGTITVAIEAGGGETRISVSDNGPGLSPEDVGRLFGRFQRLSAKPTGGEGSTGLGLSIAKHFVARHGGRLSAESRGPGQGTTFVIHLPVVEANKEEAQ